MSGTSIPQNPNLQRGGMRTEPPSRSTTIVLAIGAVVGLIMVGLGALNLLGPVGTPGFIASVGGGGALTLIASGALLWVAINNHRNKLPQGNVPPRSPSDDKPSAASKDESPPSAVTALPAPIPQPSPTDPRAEQLTEYLHNELANGKAIDVALREFFGSYGAWFVDKSQKRAEETFHHVMGALLKSEVYYPQACAVENLEGLTGSLDRTVFSLSATGGVENDIPTAAKDGDRLHVFQVASQYNASEAPNPCTPKVGFAMSLSEGDYTQGPLAQRTNPKAFELGTALLTNLGFNMLERVLPSAGTTYTPGAPIQHGYLRPTNGNIGQLEEEFRQNYSKAKYVCYSSRPDHWQDTRHPVYIFLQAAPAIAYSVREISNKSDDLQKYASLANFLAFFKFGIELAKEKNQPIRMHVTAVGCGIFGNKTENFQWGFEKAALLFQNQLKAHHVSIQLDAFDKRSVGDGIPISTYATWAKVAFNLNIPTAQGFTNGYAPPSD